MKEEEKVGGIIVSCIDFRLHTPSVQGGSVITNFSRLVGLEKFFLLTFPGGIRRFAASPGENNDFNRNFFQGLQIALEHGAKKVAILQHEDCAGYKGQYPDLLEQNDKQIRDLLIASRHLENFGFETRKFFAKLDREGNFSEIVEI